MPKPSLDDAAKHEDAQLVKLAGLGIPRAELSEMFNIPLTALAGRIKRARGRIGKLTTAQLEAAEVEDLLSLVRHHQRTMMSLDPTLTHHEVRLTRGGPCAILLAGCFQTGGRWTFHSEIKRRLEEVFVHPRAFVGGFGDEIENFGSGSFAGASSVEEQSLNRVMQRRLWNLFMKRLGKKLLWGMGSQHGSMWDERGGFSPIKDMYMGAGIPFFDGQAYVKVHVGKQTYQMALAHEFPGSSMWNVVHPQKRAHWQRYPNADVIAQADKHQYAALDTDVYGNEVLAGNRASTQLMLIQIGTAKVGPDKYTIRGWERGYCEWPWLILYDDEHTMRLTRDIDEVLWRLNGGTFAKPTRQAAR